MDEPNERTDEDAADQEPELLPPREAMSVLGPLPPITAGEDDLMMPVDPKPGHLGGTR
jgi:hypothetical protein